jgi:hypothetical protein
MLTQVMLTLTPHCVSRLCVSLSVELSSFGVLLTECSEDEEPIWADNTFSGALKGAKSNKIIMKQLNRLILIRKTLIFT